MKEQEIGRSSIPLPNRLVMTAVLLLVAACGCAILVLTTWHRFSLAIDQRQWDASEPSAYYMQVVESRPDGGFWRWAVYVQEGRPITVTLLETGEYPNLAGWLDPANLTVEQIFAVTEQFCARRAHAFAYCQFKSDPRFHFPRWVDSYELISIEVKQFVPCETVTDCTSELELPP